MATVPELQQQLAEKDAEIARLRQRLQDEVNGLQELNQVTLMLTSTLNLRDLLQQIMSAAAKLLKAEAVAGLLVDEETGELKFEGAVGDAENETVRQQALHGRQLAEWVAEHAQRLVIDVQSGDERFPGLADELAGFQIRNLLVIPLRIKDRAIGVAEIINKRDGSGFSEQDIQVAEALASQASVAIDNARLYARLADAVVAARQPLRF
jgi:GAF domain-containing protein